VHDIFVMLAPHARPIVIVPGDDGATSSVAHIDGLENSTWQHYIADDFHSCDGVTVLQPGTLPQPKS
jgi:hypothetical protein